MCKSCQKISKESISISSKYDDLPEDEAKNQMMIDEWLNKNKPSVKI
jgi:hypothetical protein